MGGMFSSGGTALAGATIPVREISKHVASVRLTRPTWVIAGRGKKIKCTRGQRDQWSLHESF